MPNMCASQMAIAGAEQKINTKQKLKTKKKKKLQKTNRKIK